MSYENAQLVCYRHDTAVDFGNTGDGTVFLIAGPAGKKGRLVSIVVQATEVFACDATPARVLVGTAADLDAYADLNIPDGTANLALYNDQDDTDAIISADLPADTAITVSHVDGTDGTAVTGQGYVNIYIAWY